MPITKEEFKNALSRFASGVTVVTTKDADGDLHGLTVSAFCSVSLEPPLILICIDKKTGSHHAFEESGTFVVNILSEDQEHLSNHFAGPIPDKFTEIEHETNGNDLPIIKNALVNLECELEHSYDGGDHTIFVGRVKKSKVFDGKPLLYCSGNYQEMKV